MPIPETPVRTPASPRRHQPHSPLLARVPTDPPAQDTCRTRARCVHHQLRCSCSVTCSSRPPQVAQYHAGGIEPGGSHHPSSGVCTGTAHIHAFHRRSILRITRNRSIEQQLIKSELALKDITLGQPHLILDIPRSPDFGMQYEVLEIRAML